MKAQVESISPVKAKLSVEIPPQEVIEEENRAYRDLQRRATLPGFRKGKAPLQALKRIYGDQVKRDVVSKLVERSYGEALRKEEIIPVSDADINLENSAEIGGISYTAVIEVRPTVTPQGYSGLSLRRERVDVSETEVEGRLEALRREHASLEPAPEGHLAEEGDMVVMDYQGTLAGEPFEGGKGEGRSVVLGTGMLVPGFEEGLKGAAAGEERSLEVDFPEDYRASELAGKRANFAVNIRELKIRRLPELDDEFARETMKTESLEELRERIRDLLRAEKGTRVEESFREHVIDSVLNANPFEVPESLVRRQQMRALEGLRQDLGRRGLDIESMGIDKAQLQENYRRGAERAVRWAFLLGAIAQTEGIAVTEEDVEARLRAIAEADGRPYQTIRAFFEEGDRLESLKSSILEKKVIDTVVASSTVEEVDAADPASGGEGR